MSEWIFYGEASEYAVLSNDEIKKLILNYQKNGDFDSKERLLKSFMKFLVKRANWYSNGSNLGELMGAATEGFEKAINKFDVNRNVNFISYLDYWIDNKMMRYLTNNYSLIRMPNYLYCRLKNIRAMIEANKSEKDIARKMKCSVQTIRNIRKIMDVFNISSIVDSENNLIDFIDDNENHVEVFSNNDLNNSLINIISCLSESESDIISSHFGIGCKRQTLNQIAERYGLTGERIRQKEKNIIKKLRGKLLKSKRGIK